MRAVVYPRHGYIADSIIKQLQRSGHEVLAWDEESCVDADNSTTWSAVLQQATAVFHELHGHEQHAKDTLLKLLQSATPQAPVTFVGISTPLTWAATPVPPPALTTTAAAAAGTEESGHLPAQDSAAATSIECTAVQPASACLHEEDAPRRRPAAAAVDTFQAEQLVLRCHRPGRLTTQVVCPGILYGAGEAESQLHALWKTAWEGQQALQICGPGSNRLPTLHVDDLAAFCEAAACEQLRQLDPGLSFSLTPAQQPPPQQQQQQQQQTDARYLLAVDPVLVTQQQLVEAIGRLLMHSNTRPSCMSLLAPPASRLLLLDLPFACSTLQQSYSRCCPRGMLCHLPQVLQELLAARTLQPLRIMIWGPPAAGKTHLGLRLAELYGLLHVNVSTILAELQHMDPETQKTAHAQLSGREGRLSQQLMARLAQHLLLRHPVAVKQGWVMEGWPRSMAAACSLTAVGAATTSSSCGASSDGGGAGGSSKAGGRRESVASAGVKDKRRSTGNSSGGATATVAAPGAGGSGRARRTCAEEDLCGSEGAALQNPDLLPHYLIELEADDEELQRRVKALAAAEAAAAAAEMAAGRAVTSSGSSSSAKKVASRPSMAGNHMAQAAAGTSGGAAAAAAGPFAAAHSNMKDWLRRMEAHRQLLQEHAADVAAKKSAVVAAYRAQMAAEAAAAAAAVAAGDEGLPHQQSAAASKGGSSGSTARQAGGDKPGSKVVTPRHAGGGGGGGRQSASGNTDGAALLPPDVQLPEHGGFVGYFVDAGARYIKVSNPFDATAAAVATPSAAASPCISRAATPRLVPDPAGPQQQKQQHQQQLAPLVPLHRLEQQLTLQVGPPHNYKGFKAEAPNAGASGAVQQPGLAEGEAPAPAPAAPAPAAGAAQGSKGGVAGGLQRVNTATTTATTAAAAAAAASVQTGVLETLLPDLDQLREVAQALAAQAALRESRELSDAAQPLASALMESLLPDLMAGLVQVALERPADPCQVIADQLLAAATRAKAAYTDPYEAPVYAIQLAKVEAKAAREAARAAAAAAKAERERAAAAAAAGGDGSGIAELHSSTKQPSSIEANNNNNNNNNNSSSSSNGSAAPMSVESKSKSVSSTQQPGSNDSTPQSGGSSGPNGSHKQGTARAAGSRASVAHGNAQPAR